MDNNINFGSTYRIPITQAGVNSAKKEKLRDLILSYPNGLIGSSKTGHARVSIPNSDDDIFVSKLKKIGYKAYQKFDGENIPKEDIDVFIKEKLDTRDYSQRGKNPKRMSKDLKAKRHYDSTYTPSAIEQIRFREQEINGIPEFVSSEDVKVFEDLEQLEKISKVASDSDMSSPFSKIERTMEEIMESEEYKACVAQEGEEFAKAIFFGIY